MWEESNPSPEMIDQAIDELIPVKFHFVVLEYDEPVQNCLYVQTLIENDNTPEIQYLLETRFVHDDDSFTHYQTFTTDEDELKRIFRMFALGVIPKTEGWKDITEDLLEKKKTEEPNA